MTDNFNEILSVIISAFVIPLLTYFCKIAVDFLEAKIDTLKTDKAIETAQTVVNAAVAEINQTYVDDLKKAGNFTDENKLIAFNKAFELASQQLTEQTKEIISQTFNGFNSWLQSQIEAAVRKK